MPEIEVSIPLSGVELIATLSVPQEPRGAVIFAHGSGSSRFSPRNRYVATELYRGGFICLLLDLLTEDEEEAERDSQHLRFDIELLAERLAGAAEWLTAMPSMAGLRVGFFGASTGAAAALVAGARMWPPIGAIVSRGGRADLAGPELKHVTAPTLLLVGSEDRLVLDLNREALERIDGPARLEIIQGASHLFEEPGALEEVAFLARAWFDLWLFELKREEQRPSSH